MAQILQLDPEQPNQNAIERAASIIRAGGLVAFPTETVYGLGADAMNERAVQKIFEAKGRPADNPLIVHVGDRRMLDVVASEVDQRSERLIQEFWPGPLTLVLKRRAEVAPSVSAGLSTVAVRMPRNQIALALIHASAIPLAAPSANTSGRPSPTAAAHVVDDLDGRIDMILDGGATNIGIESTVVDMTADTPAILRPGWITCERLTAIIGPVELATADEALKRSPGTRHRHYSPRARLVLMENPSRERLEQLCKDHLKEGSVGFIGHSRIGIVHPLFIQRLIDDNAKDYARSIYSLLRELDTPDMYTIVVEGTTEAGEGAAVMDRLRRAASEVIAEQR